MNKKQYLFFICFFFSKTSCFEVSIKGSGKDIFYPALTIGSLYYINQSSFKKTEMAYNLSTLLDAPLQDTIDFCSLSLQAAILTQTFPENFTSAFLLTGTYVVTEKIYCSTIKKKSYLRNTRNRSITLFCTAGAATFLYNFYKDWNLP